MRALILGLLAVVLGLSAAEYLGRSMDFRRWLGNLAGRGELLALVRQRGLYETDVERAWQAELFLSDTDERQIPPDRARVGKQAIRQRLIAETKLEDAARAQRFQPSVLEHEMDLLRWQFLNEKAWRDSLGRAATRPGQLRRTLAANERERDWMERQIGEQRLPNESEIRHYYEGHRAEFEEPLRLRASHLFLAAPDDYPAEVIETKRALIEQLARRLANGESFPGLVAEFSEDEATKQKGGDLNYFAANRMLPEVFAAAQQLQPGQTSAPLRSVLGFHIIRLTESLPPRSLTLEEARPEIIAQLEAQRRAR